MIFVSKVKKSFLLPNGDVAQVIKEATFELPSVGFVCILGKSGSGKSTILNLLSGIIEPTSGTIRWSGQKGPKPNVSFCFQNGNIFPRLTVFENIAIAKQKVAKDDREKIEKILEEIGISEMIDRKAALLSGGERQRVAIARAIYKDAAAVFADEPTGSLDSKTAIQVFELLKDVSKTRLVLVVTHDEELANNYADRILRISDGVVVSGENESTSQTSCGTYDDDGKPNIGLISRLSLRGVSKKPVSFILSAVLLSLSFATVSLGLGLGLGTPAKDVASSVAKSGTQNILLTNVSHGLSIKFAKQTFDSFSQEYGVDAVPVYYSNVPSGYDYDVRLDRKKENVHNPMFQKTPLSLYVPATSESFRTLGLELTSGRFPVGLDEIVIPLCQYEEYANAGFVRGDLSEIPSTAFSSQDEFLSLSPKISTSGSYSTIVGIVDTKLPDALFSYSLANNMDFFANFCEAAYKTGIPNSLHVCCFVSQEYCNKFATGIAEIVIDQNGTVSSSLSYDGNEDNLTVIWTERGNKHNWSVVESGDKNGVYATWPILRSLGGTDVIAPYYDCDNLSIFHLPGISSLPRLEKAKANKMFSGISGFGGTNAFVFSSCCEYVKANGLPANRSTLEYLATESFKILKNIDESVTIPDFSTSEGEDILKTYYAWALSTDEYVDNNPYYLPGPMFTVDRLGSGTVGKIICKEACDDLLKNNDFSNIRVSLEINGDVSTAKNYEFAGIVAGSDDSVGECYLSYASFQEIRDYFPYGRTIGAIACKTPDRHLLERLYGQYCDSFKGLDGAFLRAEIAQFKYSQNFSDRFGGFRNDLIWMSAGLFAFNLILQLTFSLLRLEGQKSTAGLILGIGGRLSDVYVYCSTEQIISSLSGCVLGVALGGILSLIINSGFMRSTGLALPIFSFPFGYILLALLIALSGAALSYLPISASLKKKGVDSLLKRE
ncbi:MAG: ABC transporter ATP-binding protein [Bacilli bacterium]|nr:ABC transporter ATP-binding protein [Bacilli bacterium]